MVAHSIVLGCGRSGTSIFGELFDHLPFYQYYSEPSYELLKSFDYKQPVAIKVPKESASFNSSAGLSFPLEDLLKTIPDPKQLFWIVRHPLDAICSLKVGIANNWGHHPKPEDWKEWLDRPLYEQCAHHWNYINSIGYNQVKDWVVLKKFEDLIMNPVDYANSICSEVGLSIEDCGEELNAWAKRVQNSNNKDFVEAKTSRAYSRNDHTVRVARWRENLTVEEVTAISPIIKDTATMMGYVDF